MYDSVVPKTANDLRIKLVHSEREGLLRRFSVFPKPAERESRICERHPQAIYVLRGQLADTCYSGRNKSLRSDPTADIRQITLRRFPVPWLS